jgi:membrane protein implicated in regulation of membrane protease activity
MNINPNQPSRRAGLIFLILACVMLLLGLTVFGKSLTGLGFLAYWLGCLALTLTAMLMAVREMREIRRQNREEKIGLMEQAFDGVTAEVKEAREKRRANSRK